METTWPMDRWIMPRKPVGDEQDKRPKRVQCILVDRVSNQEDTHVPRFGPISMKKRASLRRDTGR
jgi:hypothetical protein